MIGRSARAAFTLVELIVAMAATSVIVVLMLQLFSESSTLWQRNNDRLDTYREARAALQAMQRDFSALSPIPMSGNTMTESEDAMVDFPLLALQYHPASLEEDRQSGKNQEFYGLVASRNSGKGATCAIGYFCQWDETHTAFALKRMVTESDTTYANLNEILKVNIDPKNPNAPRRPSKPPSAAFEQLYARIPVDPDPTQPIKQTIDDMALYVWDLRLEITPPSATTPAKAWPQGFFCRQLPQWLEIRFKALGSNATRKLAGRKFDREAWFDTTSDKYKRFIQPLEQSFVTRVKLCQ